MAVLSSAPLQFVASIPAVTRAFTAATVLLSLVYYWLLWTGDQDFSVPYLVLVPGSSIFYPWTFVTSAFVETSVLEVRPRSIITASSHIHSHIAYLHPHYDTSFSKIPRAAVGCRRDPQIRCCDDCCFQHHCLWFELVGIYGFEESCLPVRVTPYLYSKLKLTSEQIRAVVPWSNGPADRSLGCFHTNNP